MNDRIIVKRPVKPFEMIFKVIIGFLVLWFIYWGFKGVSYPGLMQTAGPTFQAILRGFSNPDWEFLMDLTIDGLPYALLETVAIAIAGTFISAIISIPFSLIAAQNIVGKRRSKIGKVIITGIRAFPEIILALIFIRIIGPGAAAGVLALGIHSIGMLGKLFSESIESMDYGVAEAVEACGGNKSEVLGRAILPQVSPEFISYTMYRFEINSRAAAVLGIVGAGGIGAPLQFAIQSRDWPRMAMILISLIIAVTIIDVTSVRIRRNIVK